MHTKLILAVAASVVGNVTFIPYLVDIFRLKTTPHSYSWLVWTILQVTGALAMFASGAGGAGVLYLSIGAGLCALVFLLSLRYGTKNITGFDTGCLVGALCATTVWFFLREPLLSVVLVALIDVVAFLPTFRKTYAAPWSETLSMYFLSSIAQLLSLAALSAYTLSTTLYLVSLATTNAVFIAMVLVRRGRISEKS